MSSVTKYKKIRFKIVESELLFGGQSIFKEWMSLGCVWELKLEDDRTVLRPVKYTPDPKFRNGWGKRRSPADALPPPKFVYEYPKGTKWEERE